MLPKDTVDLVFGGQKKTIEEISVRFWPLVAGRKTSHSVSVADRQPDLVAPVVTEANVRRDGRINPIRNIIARDVLSPLPEGEFSVGTVAALDEFLTASPLVPRGDREAWPQYLNHCRKMVDAVINGWPGQDEAYHAIGSGFLEVTESASGAVRQILDLYDMLLHDKPEVPLLAQYAVPDATKMAGLCKPANGFAQLLGHSNDRFPLADQQRQVLAHLGSANAGAILAVNGPPGTGKTTMLLSAIAGEWIAAALNKAMPPVIVAASSNNQAVTNIIDAFGKDFGRGDGPFAGRWLPDIASFGLFLASFSREAIASKTYQTESFFPGVENEDYVLRAKKAYLTAAHSAFPDLANPNVGTVVSVLHDLMLQEVAKFSDADKYRAEVERCLNTVTQTLGSDPDASRVRLLESQVKSASDHDAKSAYVAAWENHQASESGLLAVFGFLPPIAKKRLLRARLALADAGCEIDDSECKTLAAIDAKLRADRNVSRDARQKAADDLDTALKLLSALQSSEQGWDSAVSALGATPVPISQADQVDRFADCQVRFRLFLLATHYWEGRWLDAMEEDLANIAKSQSKTGLSTVIPRWQRRMMLTPCAVSTFASLPGKLTYTAFSEGSFEKKYLLNFVDLLIIDEAGQVLPEVAGASFAFAKRALVIGDTQQIEPISLVLQPVDIGNLRDCGLLSSGFTEDDLGLVSARGLRSVGGSAMRLAQEAYGAFHYPDLQKGLYLFEHRRCYDEIISYCNMLCYNGALKPKRGGAPKETVLPAMGYLQINGMAVSHGGSRANVVEARTIARWLAANRADLEQSYGLKLEQIVGVVTPFGRQAREIREACAELGILVSGREGMAIGTVHSLQGAERPVVIFSPVYSKHADGQFIDISASMLNVTVSRAKDSFLVFGDMDMFSTAVKGSPRALLAEFLFVSVDNLLSFESEPRPDLQAAGDTLFTLREAVEHDDFLLEALASDGQNYSIVSPWVIVATMEQSGLIKAFQDAVSRGAKIEVFVDPELNQSRNAAGISHLEAAGTLFAEIGVVMHKVRLLHSKIVAVDRGVLCIGSYNWLSADRHGKYARYETSMVYRGPQLQGELDVIRENLKSRTQQ